MLERHQEANDRFFSEHDEAHDSDEAFEQELRKNWLEAARHYDPNARLSEELTVQLQGEAARRGALDFRVGDALLRPLREGVSAAARRSIDLELTGVSHGSTVLHVRPSLADEPEEESAAIAPIDSSTADPAIRDLLKLIDAAEHERDIREWERVIPGLDHVVEALDKFDLSMNLRWSSLDGTVRSSTLSRRGKGYVRSLRALETQKTRRPITGRITELRESGLVKIKMGPSKTSKAYDVRIETEDLIDMHLELGATVSFLVQEVRKVDKIGRPKSTEYFFIALSDNQGVLPED
ncbi:hypothetical protein [Streptomyces daqingensis]|uniref:hypothetical protein n=1 Tax=Streptomyces daqingensis TaxID=1472640 RepID=UPI001E28D993|nr:hypothetical protein [Streptomyces daqingensis]